MPTPMFLSRRPSTVTRSRSAMLPLQNVDNTGHTTTKLGQGKERMLVLASPGPSGGGDDNPYISLLYGAVRAAGERTRADQGL